MPTTQQHIIRRQFLHVELFGTESDGLALQRRLPELCRLALLPALDVVLDRAVPAHTHLSIDRLEVDAGAVELATLERDLVVAVSQAIEKKLREQIGPTTIPEGSQPAPIRRRTEQESAEDAFVFFLHTGSLPWWFRRPAGRSLEQAIADAWQRATPPDASPASFQADVLDAIGSTSVRQRLVTQFSPDFLASLLARLSSPGLKAMREACIGLESAAIATRGRQRFVRQLWQTTFSGLAEGQVRSARSLVARSWHALTSVERQAPGLSEWMASHWPEAIEVAPPDAGGGADVMPRGDSPSGSQTVAAQATSHLVPASEAASGQPTAASEQSGPTNHLASSQTRLDETARSPVASGIRPPQDESEQAPAGQTGREESGASPTLEQSFAQSHGRIASASGAADSQGENAWQARPQAERDDRPGQITIAAAQAAAGGSGKSPGMARPAARIDLSEGVYVDCAGVILLHPFLPRFFETLGIADDDRLLQPDRALCLLHFLATGQRVAPEHALTLTKLLCNVPFAMPVEADVELTVAETEEADALLAAVIGHWDTLRNTSPDGLRGSFLVRPGKISQRSNGDYLLQVESQSFDILLDSLPWGLGVVKLPWMERMLWVEWAH